MIVSIIIPAYNASATIERTLKALSVQDFTQDYEVIVVNDGSTDRTADVIRAFPHVKLITQENAGPASARNTGAKYAKGGLLCFTDADCVPHPDWIALLEKDFHRSDIAVVCGSYGIANPESPLSQGIHEEIMFRHHVLMPDFPKVFGSYNFCIKKDVFDSLGGFDTRYRSASGEDNDLSYRLIAAGHKIFFERKALVDHYHTTSVVKYLKEQYRHGHWRMTMYADHPQMLGGDSYTFWKDVLEVPWSLMCVLGCGMIALGMVSTFAVIYFLILPFWIFEIYFAHRMMKNYFESLLYGNVMFFRAFARSFGLSTGILYILWTKIKKNPK